MRYLLLLILASVLVFYPTLANTQSVPYILLTITKYTVNPGGFAVNTQEFNSLTTCKAAASAFMKDADALGQLQRSARCLKK